ncbi:phage holin family protein [Hydrotalea sp.]|uniref:phage holin family protein n=1 Tax=Hydrotalea sp. TaxID=2881279 RepID=UPI003D09EFFC
MISFLSKVLFTSVAVLVATYILSGVHVNSATTAILVAVVLGLLNTFVKPILIILTIPFTILTLGLFLLVINVLIIKWTSELVPGFRVDGWWSALFFSIIVSLVSSFIEGLVRNNEA